VSVGEDGPSVGAGAGTGGFGVALEMEQTDLLALLQDLQVSSCFMLLLFQQWEVREIHQFGEVTFS